MSDLEPRPRVGRLQARCLRDNRKTARRQQQLLLLPRAKPAGPRSQLGHGVT